MYDKQVRQARNDPEKKGQSWTSRVTFVNEWIWHIFFFRMPSILSLVHNVDMIQVRWKRSDILNKARIPFFLKKKKGQNAANGTIIIFVKNCPRLYF